MILFIIGILFILIIVIITLIYFRKNNNDNLSMLIDRYGTHDLSSEMGYEWNNAHNLYKTLIFDKNTYEVKVFFKIHVPSDLISEVESFSKGIEYNSINNEVLIIGNDIYSILAKIIGIILISHRVRPAIYEEIYE